MKKFLSILVAVALFAALLVPAAFAAGTAAVTADVVTGKPGETVTVTVSIENNPGFDSAKFTVSYDKNALTLVSLDGSMLAGASNVATGMINHASAADVTGDGVLFTATFTVNSGATYGDYVVGITVNKLSNEGKAISCNVINGGVVVLHDHNWSSEWTTDGESHWKTCECGEVKDKGVHQFQWVVDEPATESKTGLKHEECTVCGYKRNEGTVIPKVGHGTFSDEWSYDDNGHWHECSCGCGERSGEGAHTLDWIVTREASYEQPGLKEEICTVCGYKTGRTEEIPQLTRPSIGGSTNTPPVVTLPFEDVEKGSWYYEAVEMMYATGLMNGTGDGDTFSPYMNMSRAMLVTVLYRMDGCPKVEFKDIFPDVPAGQWYSEAVIWAHNNGIVKGYDNGYFGTNDNVSREQIAVFLYRLAKHQNRAVAPSGDLTPFVDDEKSSDWAVEGLKWAVGAGIVQGKDGGRLDPTGSATRCEVATMLYRYIIKYGYIIR